MIPRILQSGADGSADFDGGADGDYAGVVVVVVVVVMKVGVG